ncbi:MAG: CHAD domain-containing protein [Thermostichales cyanobacterium SZTDM-1c_bins_54]
MVGPDSLAHVWRQSLLVQVDGIEQLYPDLLEGRAVKAIHDLRVTFRRLQSLWEGLTTLIPDLGEQAPVLWWRCLSPLGKVRDLDVQIERLKTWQQTRLVKALKQRRRQRLTKLRRQFPASWWQGGLQRWRTWLAQTPWHPPLDLEATALIPDLIAPALGRWLLHPGWASRDPHDPLLHELRKLGKKLRYQGELFTPWYGPAWQDWLGELQRMQSTLGTLHDLQVLHGLVQAEAGGQELADQLVEAMAATWQEWQGWRERWTSPGQRQRLHRLVCFAPEPLPEEVRELTPAV